MFSVKLRDVALQSSLNYLVHNDRRKIFSSEEQQNIPHIKNVCFTKYYASSDPSLRNKVFCDTHKTKGKTQGPKNSWQPLSPSLILAGLKVLQSRNYVRDKSCHLSKQHQHCADHFSAGWSFMQDKISEKCKNYWLD